jgi:hypothetical protein
MLPMTQALPIADRRWYRTAHWVAAVGTLAACIYFVATRRDWLPGPSSEPYSLLLLGSSTALIWSMLALRRHAGLAIVLLVPAAVLLTWSIVSFVQSS